MELPEPVQWINKRLQDEFGYLDIGRPYWRVVFSDEQFEKRFDTWRDFDKGTGVLIREVAEVREVPKYSWIRGKWVLERLVETPIPNLRELLGNPCTYEPVWVFEGKNDEPIPPTFRGCRFIVDTVFRQAARAVGAKYKDPDAGLDSKQLQEKKIAELDKLEKEIFGDETKVGDALARDSGVGYGVRQRNDSIRKAGE